MSLIPVYYPAVCVNLIFRFDELLQLRPDGLPPQTTAELLSNSAAGSMDGTNGGTPLVVQSKTTSADGTAQQQVSFLLHQTPKSLHFEEGHVRAAGTFHCTLDFRVLPIDPRVLRAATIEIHVGTVTAANFGQGMLQYPQPGARTRRLSQLTPRDATPDQPNSGTLRMVCTVDDVEVEHTETQSTISLSGRDLRALLIDSKINSLPQDAGHTTTLLDHLNTNRPIDEVVFNILAQHTMLDNMHVISNKDEWPNGIIPSPGQLPAVPRHRRGARGLGVRAARGSGSSSAGGARGGAGGNGARHSMRGGVNQMSFWDVIVQLCTVCGAAATLVGRDLMIRPVRSLYDDARAQMSPVWWQPQAHTPFNPDAPRTMPARPGKTGEQFSIRRMILGSNIQRLKFKRTFAGNQRPRTIRVVADNSSNGQRGIFRRTVVQYPPAAATTGHANRTSTSGQNGEDIVTISSHGITDPAQMLEMARSVWEDIGRNELTGTCECGQQLSSFGGSNEDPDLLFIRPSDPVELLAVAGMNNRSPLITTINQFQNRSFEEALRAIRQWIPDENLARVMLASARGQIMGLLRFFRVSAVRGSWDMDKGWDLSFDFQNYIVPRFGQSPPADTASLGTARGRIHRRTTPHHAAPTQPAGTTAPSGSGPSE